MISSNIKRILNTTYQFPEKKEHANFAKKFIYNLETKYLLTPIEDELLKLKFDQLVDELPLVGIGWDDNNQINYFYNAKMKER